MKRKSAKFELILFFERFHFQPKEAIRKLEKHGYKRATIYRYQRNWSEADMIVKQIQKDL